MLSPFSLQCKIILIVGASSGIGRSIAIECSKMGAKLILAARNREGLEETASMLTGDGHTILPTDILDESERDALVSCLPVVDGLVMSAGVWMIAPIAFSTPQKACDVFAINYFSQVELVRLINKKKRMSKAASIIFISSIAGTALYTHGNSIYGSTKAAIDSFMKYAALEYSSKKIRVNAINPGMIYTPLSNKNSLSAEDTAADIALYPLKRYGQPEEVAYAAVYLLSDASAWVTGHALVIDGGRSI